MHNKLTTQNSKKSSKSSIHLLRCFLPKIFKFFFFFRFFIQKLFALPFEISSNNHIHDHYGYYWNPRIFSILIVCKSFEIIFLK
ncbi:hypothetical protein C1645_157429 [Glomus cerebriforme]|uniref:Uncharacterized protein n=1 Tax=Glomus cerebriforme TaxID=658196 RepID=A0A397T0G6_9GLOM|nr:hypothetical protein C1645_157429 [Glomus cerebriforme]